MSHCKIHRVQHLNVSRAADAPAEWVNNNLRSLEDKGLLESKADTTENGTEITFKPTE